MRQYLVLLLAAVLAYAAIASMPRMRQARTRSFLVHHGIRLGLVVAVITAGFVTAYYVQAARLLP